MFDLFHNSVPYTDFQQKNLDWLTETVRKGEAAVEAKIEEADTAIENANTAKTGADDAATAANNAATAANNAKDAANTAAAHAEASAVKYGSPLTSNTVAGMTDHTRIYVYTGTEAGMVAGNWYFWDGDSWESGGVYVGNVNEAVLFSVVQSKTAAEKAQAQSNIGMPNVLADLAQLQTDVGNLSDTLEGYEDIFTGDVETSVENWLNEHPEATTTVEDGAITEAKLNASLLPSVINSGYTIIGATNDVGSMVNTALASHDVVIVPEGEYTLDETILLNNVQHKTLIILGKISYSGVSPVIEIRNSVYCHVWVDEIEATNGTCIKIDSQSALCEFNDIHSRYLYGDVCIDFQATGSGTSGVQHINVFSDYIRAVSKGVNMEATSPCWIGEVKFFGGEINGVAAKGIYTNGLITAIRAFGLGFETLATLMDLNGTNNECTFYGCRAEGTGPIKLSGIVLGFLYDGFSTKIPDGIDITGLTSCDSVVFRGYLLSHDGIPLGNEYQISHNNIGYISDGNTHENYAYAQTYGATSGEIGGALTYNICPKVVRISTAGTFTLSEKYNLLGLSSLLVYCVVSGITIKNHDESKTLFTSTAANEVWRITSAPAANNFSPSGYLIEKVTQVV